MQQYEIENMVKEMKDHYIYVKGSAEYYWVEQQKFFKPKEVESNLMCTKYDLYKLRKGGAIPSYDGLCYFDGGKEKCFNLYDEKTKLLPDTKNAIENDSIKELLHNIAGHKAENIEYLYKLILYKYTHLNDFTIPALVLYGVGGSGKGTFISLLQTIFGEENVLANLGQADISGNFDTYTGKKLIVEFAEISTNNTSSDIRILNKLKNIIGAEKITINEKNRRQYQVENIALFIISSNSNKPLQLDDKDKGNRRFSIMRSTTPLQNGKEVNQVVRDKKIVAEFLTWLFQKYPDVAKMEKLEALDNKDKRELEDRAQSEANEFWDWFEESYPELGGKITLHKINEHIDSFCMTFDIDTTDFKKYFWNHSKYPKKKIRIADKTHYGVHLPEKTKFQEQRSKNSRTLELSDVQEVF